MMKTPRLAGLLALMKAENEEENEVTYDYDALTPSLMNEEDAKHYINALNFACHKPDIKNIAVTGPYGAGKSSVLLTWSKRRQEDLKIMTVSLADFDMIRATTETDEKSAEPGTKTEKKAKQEKSIEYSILQQILYKARKSDLPYSRIERIADVTPSQMRKMALGLLATLGCGLSGLIFLFPDYFRNKLSVSTAFSEFILNIPSVLRIGVLAGGAFFVMFYLLLSKLHRMGIFDRRVSIDKIDLSKGATISTRPSDPSLLNVFIDEIVYFFEKQKYNVVIFEDLDRHNDGAIFIKLREINQIINSSRTPDDHVRFIYAVRDDIFNSPEARTKFFDFVMPVIPVMDSQNVTDHFLKKFRNEELDVAGFEQCISRIAIFIPDMRVLNSIANEFRLYRNLVNNGEDIIRLLSLIAYKNICSRDYHLIDSKQGILYGVIDAHVSGGLSSIFEGRIAAEIDILNTQISEITDETEKDKSDLIREILSVYISEKIKGQVQFCDNYGTVFTLEQVVNDENVFYSMLGKTGLFVRTIQRGINLATITSEEAEEISSEYQRRCELLNSKSDGKLADFEKRAEQLRQRRRRLQSIRPGTLIERMGSEGFRSWVSDNLHIDCSPDSSEGYTASQFDFIYSLLRWGYLSTDYMSYRSVFIPGSLSSSDNDFIRAVSAGREPSATASMTLDRTANVVEKLKELGLLLQDNAWHASVLLYLLEHDQRQLGEIIQIQLEDGEEHRLEQLCRHAFCSWSAEKSIVYAGLITSDTRATEEFLSRLRNMSDKKSAVKLLVILFCSSELRWNYETTDMTHAAEKIFSEHGDIPDVVPDGYAESFTDNLRLTRVVLSRIDDCNSEQGREIVSALAGLNLWRYSKENLLNMIKVISGYREVVYEKLLKEPFKTLESFNVPGLLDAVNNNVNSFISDIFIFSDEYGRVPTVLNNPAASFEKIQQLVQEMDFLIPDVSKINERSGLFLSYKGLSVDASIHTLLLDNNRIEPTWKNLRYLLNLNVDLNPWLALWFDKNHDKLSDIPTALSSSDIYLKLINNLYSSGALSDAARKQILSAIQLTLLSLPENLTVDQAALMVKYGRLAPVRSVYQQLFTAFYEEGDTAVTLLAGLVLQHPKLLEEEPDFILINDGEFDYTLARHLLTSKDLPGSVLTSTLQWLWGYNVELFDGPLFINSSTLLRLLTLFRDENILRALLVQSLTAGDVTHDVIVQVLGALSDPVSRAFISDLNHRSLDLTEDELELARLLESAGFMRALKEESKEGRFRFVPHNSPAFRRE